MKHKIIIKRIIALAMAAGITVNSIPLSAYAATFSQTEEAEGIREPEETTTPEAIPEPEATMGPEATTTPEETMEPEETATPEVIPEPEETMRPEETATPEAIQEPEATMEPEATTTPEAIQEPETTMTPESTPAVEEPTPENVEEADAIEKAITKAKEALKELLSSECVMALVYLSDYYQVMDRPENSGETVATLGSGHTVLLEDVEADIESGSIWYLVSFAVDGTEYSGYIEKTNLAYSNEKLLAFEEEYIKPLEKFFEEKGIALVKDSNADGLNGYSSDIALFPQSYQSALQALKNAHPNWTFVKFDTGLDFNTVVKNELVDTRSLIYVTAQDSFKGAQYEGNWYYATQDAVEYYLDPRNGFTEKRIFQFEQLTFNSSYHKASAIQDILNSSFMSGTVPKANVSYAQAFYEIGQSRGISPFHLASRVLQEQGVKGGSALISGTYSGYEGYYNYFNIGASGSTQAAVIKSGLERAKKEGWDTPYKSLSGGAKSIGNGYILQGQDTLYLQKWDVESSYNGLYWHQYMQNIQAPTTESSTIRSLYESSGSLNSTFVFKIPVYRNMTGVTLSPASLTLKGGHSDTITYTIGNVNGQLSECRSSDTAVAVAEKTGENVNTGEGNVTGEVTVTATGKGTATITLVFSDGTMKTCKVTVEGESITLSEKSVTVSAGSLDGSIDGGTTDIVFTINNAKSGLKDLAVSDTNLLLASEKKNSIQADEEQDTLTGKIQLSGLNPGTATVTVSSEYGSTAVCKVTIIRLPEKVEILPQTSIVSVGDSRVLSAKVLPEDTTNKTVVWSSSNEKVVKVNAATGRITAVGTGTATITARTEDNTLSGKQAADSYTVRVIPLLSSLKIAEEEKELLLNDTIAETFEMDGRVYLLDGVEGTPVLQTTENHYYDVYYKSSDETVVSVDADGHVEAVGPGSAMVTAVAESEFSSDTQTAVCRVNVVPERIEDTPIPDDGYVQPKEIEIYNTQTGELMNACELIAGGYVDVTYAVLPIEADNEGVTFKSSNEKVAKVSQEADGIVRITAGTRGNAVITAAADIGILKRINVTVKEKQEIEEITLDRTSAVLFVNGRDSSGQPATLQLTASKKGGTENDIVYQWDSANESVATVDESGFVKALLPGTTVITAEDTGGSGKYAKCTITVERCIEELRTNVEEIHLRPGKKITLLALTSPEDATIENMKWKSGDEAIATVTDKGVVTVSKEAEEGEQTVITVTDTVTGLHREIPLTVTETVCSKVTLYGKSGEIADSLSLYQNGSSSNQQLTISPSGYDKENTVIDSLSFYAKSSNEKIASVLPNRDSNGEYDGTFQIVAKQKGNVTIKIYAADGSGKSASVKIAVKVHPETLSINQDALYLKAGEKSAMKATITPGTANDKTVVWKFTDETPSIVREAFILDEDSGKVTVKKETAAGVSAEFVAVTRDGGIVSDNTCRVIVVATPAKKIELNASSFVLAGDDITKLEAKTLTAALLPAQADEAYELKAVSSNEEVAVVEANKNEDGLYDGSFTIMPTGYGMTTITVQTPDHKKKAVCKVYISTIDKACKLSGVTKTINLQSYDSDINSSDTLKIRDQFGRILNNKLFTFKSNKPELVSVDENGVVKPGRGYEVTKNGSATITAALSQDPYGRKVKFKVNVLSKQQAESVFITVQNIRGETLENPESIAVKYPVSEDDEGNAVNTIMLTAQTANVYGESMDTGVKWTVSDGLVASIKASKDSASAILTVKKAGKFYVICTANDTMKKSRRLQVTVSDGKPVFKNTRITINQQTQPDDSGYVPANVFELVANKDSAIRTIMVKEAVKGKDSIDADACKVEEINEGSFCLSIKESVLTNLSAGNYKAVLLVETEAVPEIDLGSNGTIFHEMPVTISIVNKKPSASIKAVSINRQNVTELYAPLIVTSSGEAEWIEAVANQENGFDRIFDIDEVDNGYVIVLKQSKNYNLSSMTGKVNVKLKGYANPVTVKLKVNTPLSRANVVSASTPSMNVKNAADSSSQVITLYNKTTKQKLTNYKIVEVPADAKLEITNAGNEDGSLRPGYNDTITVRAKDNVTYKNGAAVTVVVKVMALTEDGRNLWASAADAKITVKTYTASPSVSFEDKTLILNTQAAKEKAKTGISINRSNMRIPDEEQWEISLYDGEEKSYSVVKNRGMKAVDTKADIIFTYNRQKGMLQAALREEAKVDAGNYKYRISWIAEDDSVVKGDITVTVTDKKPCAQITAKGKPDLLRRSDSALQGTVWLSNIKSDVKSVTVMETDNEGNMQRNRSFYSTWLSDNAFRIKVLDGAQVTAGMKTIPVRIVLEGGTVLYANVSFLVNQSKPKVSIPKAETIYQSGRNTTVVYDLNKQIPSGYKISMVKPVFSPEGIGVTCRDGRVYVSLTDCSAKPGTYSIKINMYFKGAQSTPESNYGTALQKTLKVIIK